MNEALENHSRLSRADAKGLDEAEAVVRQLAEARRYERPYYVTRLMDQAADILWSTKMAILYPGEALDYVKGDGPCRP